MKRRTGRIVALAYAAAFTATGASAQQAKMYGTVRDETGTGVQNARVILEPVENGARVEAPARGKNGSYLIGIIRPGRYALKIDAPGLALIRVKADAVGMNENHQKETRWKLDGRLRLDEPTEIQVEDGMEITCDLVVGKGTEITTATGEKTVMAGDQLYALLARQVQQGDCTGALPRIDKFVEENAAHGRAFYLKGYCNAVLQRDDAALAALAKSRELDPGFAGSNTLIGKINARNKRLPDAEEAFRREIEGGNAPPEIQLDALLSLGAVQRDRSKDADAIATFEKALALAPSRPESYAELSALYAKLGQTDKAAAILEEAREAGAEDPRALLNVGIACFNKKESGRAEAIFRRVTETKASNSELAMAFGLLGKLQMRDGKNADAIESLKKSLELDPGGRLAKETEDALNALKPNKR